MEEKEHLQKKDLVQTSGVLRSMIHPHFSKTDPAGSYTGVPVEPDEVPVQDADDL